MSSVPAKRRNLAQLVDVVHWILQYWLRAVHDKSFAPRQYYHAPQHCHGAIHEFFRDVLARRRTPDRCIVCGYGLHCDRLALRYFIHCALDVVHFLHCGVPHRCVVLGQVPPALKRDFVALLRRPAHVELDGTCQHGTAPCCQQPVIPLAEVALHREDVNQRQVQEERPQPLCKRLRRTPHVGHRMRTPQYSVAEGRKS